MFKYQISDLTIENIKAVIKSYQSIEDPQLTKLHNYYRGIQEIGNKQVPEGHPNNKVCTNFCRLIADTYAGAGNIDNAKTDNDDIRRDADAFSSCFKDALIGGIAYFLAYLDEGVKHYTELDPRHSLILYDQSIAKHKIGACTWNPYTYYEDGVEKEAVDLYIYTESTVTHYHGSSIDDVTFDAEDPHYFKGIPLFEVHISPRYESIFDQVIDLQDSYNMIDSSYVDGRETFSNCFLTITGMGVTEESANDLIDPTNKILNLPSPGSSAQYLIKPDSASDVITVLSDIRSRIFSLTSTPDFESDKFSVASGTSIRNRLVSFENKLNSIIGQYMNTIEDLKLIVGEFDYEILDFLPIDTDLQVKLVKELQGIVSNKTLLTQLPFIKNVDAELKLLAQEGNRDNIVTEDIVVEKTSV